MNERKLQEAAWGMQKFQVFLKGWLSLFHTQLEVNTNYLTCTEFSTYENKNLKSLRSTEFRMTSQTMRFALQADKGYKITRMRATDCLANYAKLPLQR